MSGRLQSTTSERSISSAAACRAKISALLGRVRASLVLALVYGETWLESWASFDRATSSWRMCRPSEVEDSRSSSGTWPRAGTMLGGTVYRLLPSARPISGTGYSSSAGDRWRTPMTSDGRRHNLEWPGYGHRIAVRRLNPDWVECLQGFPVGWTKDGPLRRARGATGGSRRGARTKSRRAVAD